jgi:hypothetical protein
MYRLLKSVLQLFLERKKLHKLSNVVFSLLELGNLILNKFYY